MELGIKAKFSKEQSFEEIEQKVRELLQSHGFGILTEIDVKATMKAKLNVDTPRYKILGACNPPRAHKVLTIDPEIGLLLPCNVIIYENEDGSIMVSAVNAEAMFSSLIKNDNVKAIAKEVSEIFTKVIEELKNHFNE